MFNRRSLMMLVTILMLVSAAQMVMSADGSARFTVLSPVFVAGQELKAGQFDIEWTGSPEATVVFKQIGKPQPVLTVKGKIELMEAKGDYNSLQNGKDSAGREAIKGIVFGSKKVRIVFE